MKLFLIACLCYMFFATGYAVMCYQCQNCGDNKKLNASQLIQCSNSTCQTNTTRGYVVRTCGDHNLTTGCNTVTNGSLNFEVCVCEGDGCNGLDTNSPTVAITTSTNEPTTSTNEPTTSTNEPTTSTNGPTTSTNEPTTSTNEPTTSTNEPTTSITELITSIAELITSNAGFVEFGTNEPTTLTSEPTTSGAGTIKSSKIVGSVISLLVAKCIIIYTENNKTESIVSITYGSDYRFYRKFSNFNFSKFHFFFKTKR
ncbi:uncharacterized protein LOC120347629 [Styela clava]